MTGLPRAKRSFLPTGRASSRIGAAAARGGVRIGGRCGPCRPGRRWSIVRARHGGRPAVPPPRRRVCPEALTKPVMSMPERSFRPLLYALALTGVLADQASKYGVFAWLAERPGNRFTVFRDPAEAKREAAGVQEGVPNEREHGFFLEVGFERSADGKLTPHVNHGALFGFLRDYETLANL